MGWSIGYDENWKRWIGYGVPAYCDHPKCNERIDRGLAYVCCDQAPYGGNRGCGLFFCGTHADVYGRCPKCRRYDHKPYKPKPEHPDWLVHILMDKSWAKWRKENPKDVEKFKAALRPDSYMTKQEER